MRTMTYEERSRALREGATPGPWVAEETDGYQWLIAAGQGPVICNTVQGNDQLNAAHIVFTHNTAEAVEKVVEAAREVRKYTLRADRGAALAGVELDEALAALDSISEEGK